jgi:hypothetical protein
MLTLEDKIIFCFRRHYSDAYTKYWISKENCEVPGCSAPSEPCHHIRTRGAGGKDDAGNLLALCALHHRQVHDAGADTFAARYPALAGKIRAARSVPR